MSIRYAATLVAIPLLLLWGAESAQADPLDGQYMIPFSGPQSIWPVDVDELQECQTDSQDGIDIEVCIDVTTQRDARGRVTGTGSFEFTASDGSLTIEGTLVGGVTGKVKGSDTKGSKGSIKLRFEGTTVASMGGQTRVLPTRASGKITYKTDLQGMSTGGGVVKTCVRGAGCETIPFVSDPEMEDPGPWTITLDLTLVDGKKIAGTALIALADGAMYDLVVKGKYNPKKDLTSVSAKGQGASKGARFKLKNAASSGAGAIDAGKAFYRVGGFAGRTEL